MHLFATGKVIPALFAFLITGIIPSMGQAIPASEYDVYSRVLNAFLKEVRLEGKLLIVQMETDTQTDLELDEEWPPSAKEFYPKFDSIRKMKMGFENFFHLKYFNVKVVRRSEIDSLFLDHAETGWATLLKHYPQCAGIVYMSRLALSNDKTIGIFYVGYGRPGCCGEGSLVYFNPREKKPILQKHRVWVE